MRFTKTNCQLIWGTYFTETINNNNNTYISDIVISEDNYIYCTGQTTSPDLPIFGGGDIAQGVSVGVFDCFLVKFDYTGTLVWSSYT